MFLNDVQKRFIDHLRRQGRGATTPPWVTVDMWRAWMADPSFRQELWTVAPERVLALVVDAALADGSPAALGQARQAAELLAQLMSSDRDGMVLDSAMLGHSSTEKTKRHFAAVARIPTVSHLTELRAKD
jgi:hypothetical protein